MRIAQVAPLFESVPPRFYGGTERVVSWLTEELLRRGHDVTLFASGDSRTGARLISPCDRALRLDPSIRDEIAPHVLMLEHLFQRAEDFDVVHLHLDHLHFPVVRRLGIPTVTTLHGRLDLPELIGLFKEFTDVPVVSISDAQREPAPWLDWQATVHHGMPPDSFRFIDRSEGYLAFLGRTSPEKGLDDAIAIARAAGKRLRIVAKIDDADRAYHEEVIAPLLDEAGVEFLGEIPESEKQAFLGGADALLFPIRWPEPFGIAMIEALACGTPVVATPFGSVPEIVDDGVNGIIVGSAAEAIERLDQVLALDRRIVRRTFDERFTVDAMADGYLEVYTGLTNVPDVRAPRAS